MNLFLKAKLKNKINVLYAFKIFLNLQHISTLNKMNENERNEWKLLIDKIIL